MRTLGPGSLQATVRSLYVHVPFCSHKCHYCDFYSLVDQQNRQDSFTQRLIRELHALAPFAAGAPLQTIFVGGGTPSLLRPDLWRQILSAVSRDFDLSDMGSGSGEFTVECNPESVTPELLDVLAGGGVNRVSMGAQSFRERHLKTLERKHNPENVARALELARGAGIRRHSVDLIFGIPGQTLDEWTADLDAAAALGTEHLSCYNLTYEPGTAMTARLKRGEFQPAEEDVEVDMYIRTVERLRRHGFDRYEISNYSKPGAESRHNLVYWRQGQWLAAGPSASAHVAGWRWKNRPRLDDYLTQDQAGLPEAIDIESPDSGRALHEWAWTGLRLREGIDADELFKRASSWSEGAPPRLQALASVLQSRGHLVCRGTRWQLSDAGMLLADGIAVDVMAAIDG